MKASADNRPYELIGLRWDTSSHRVIALISPTPEPDTAVVLILDDRQIPMRPMSEQSPECWLCEVPEGIASIATAFGSARLEKGSQHWLTNIRWLDDLAELHHAAQAAKFLDPIKGLENSATAAEQRRILEDLQLVDSALFSDSATFQDAGFASAPEAPQDSEPAPPVDPALLIRNLTEGLELMPLWPA